MPRVFLSYRKSDSVYATAAVADRVARQFGQENVFRDRDSLPLGVAYPRRILSVLERSDIVLALVGAAWLDVRDGAGRRRLDDPEDWVRMELRMAFEREIPVVPVLLDGTPMPEARLLPADIAALNLSTYWHVRHQSFESDVRGLIRGLTGDGERPPSAPEPQAGQNVQHNQSNGSGPFFANQGHQIINGRP
ncbi:MAG: toll/interleukin-1 receptor domain-containing protein [Umezawaea sp.]